MNLRLLLSSTLAIGLITGLATGCSSSDGDGCTEFTCTTDIDATGTVYTYVLDELTVPATAAEGQAFGADVDGNGTIDNKLATILSLIGAQGNIDIQERVDTSQQAGAFILLAAVQTTGFADATGAGIRIALGENPSPAACTDANDPLTCGQHLNPANNPSFDVSASSPADAVLGGNFANGAFTSDVGTVTIELALVDGTPPLSLELVGAKSVFSGADADGIASGKLTGAISQDAVENELIPNIAELINSLIIRDCATIDAQDPNYDAALIPDACGGNAGYTWEAWRDACGESTGIVALFTETQDDCRVTGTELLSNTLLSGALSSDVDLFDENGNFAPREDVNAELDSLSLGVGFKAIKSTYTIAPLAQ